MIYLCYVFYLAYGAACVVTAVSGQYGWATVIGIIAILNRLSVHFLEKGIKDNDDNEKTT